MNSQVVTSVLRRPRGPRAPQAQVRHPPEVCDRILDGTFDRTFDRMLDGTFDASFDEVFDGRFHRRWDMRLCDGMFDRMHDEGFGATFRGNVRWNH